MLERFRNVNLHPDRVDKDYLIANPPYGKDWKRDEAAVRAEHERGVAGRFAPGLPRISDGQLLFLLHMLAHAKEFASPARHIPDDRRRKTNPLLPPTLARGRSAKGAARLALPSFPPSPAPVHGWGKAAPPRRACFTLVLPDDDTLEAIFQKLRSELGAVCRLTDKDPVVVFPKLGEIRPE